MDFVASGVGASEKQRSLTGARPVVVVEEGSGRRFVVTRSRCRRRGVRGRCSPMAMRRLRWRAYGQLTASAGRVRTYRLPPVPPILPFISFLRHPHARYAPSAASPRDRPPVKSAAKRWLVEWNPTAPSSHRIPPVQPPTASSPT